MAHGPMGSHDHDIETGQVAVAAGVRRPPEPGAEVAGPPLTDLVAELRSVAQGMERLYREAIREAQVRTVTQRAPFQTDSNGDGAVDLFQVPQGATGYLTRLVANLGDTTPAAPVTAATLWHAILGGQAGTETFAQAFRNGTLLAFQPDSPAADAQLPAQYEFGDFRTAPCLVGPQTFIFVVDGATANSQIVCQFTVLIVQPEP